MLTTNSWKIVYRVGNRIVETVLYDKPYAYCRAVMNHLKSDRRYSCYGQLVIIPN